MRARWQVFAKLRWPSAMPFLFASMKVGIAISLIGAVVGELSNNAGGGLGVRLLTGSYNGQTIQIWAALFLAAGLAAVLVIAVGRRRAAGQPRDGSAGMSRLQAILAGLAGGAALASLGLALLYGGAPILFMVFAALGALTLLRFAVPVSLWVDGAHRRPRRGGADPRRCPPTRSSRRSSGSALVATWAFAWLFVERLSQAIRRREVPGSAVGVADPGGLRARSCCSIWEVVTRGADVPQVLLPAPSQIWARLAASVPIALGRFPADLPQGRARRLRARLRLGLPRRHPRRPLAAS